MKPYLRSSLLLAFLSIAACSDSSRVATLAQQSHASVTSHEPGVNVGMGNLKLNIEHYGDLASVSFSVAPKAGTYSKPLMATYEKTWLNRKGAYDGTAKRLRLPVFGLYAGYANVVSVTATFLDGSVHVEKVTMETAAYAGPEAVYDAPEIKTARSPGNAAGFDYIFIDRYYSAPVVIDSDGNLRWAAADLAGGSSLFTGDGFYVGDSRAPVLYRLELDGTLTAKPLANSTFTNFHHALASGKHGLLAPVDAVDNGVAKIESILAEITADGQVLRQWDMAAIFRDFMRAHGDDPSNFVRDGFDWFHMNSVIYDPADDSLLVSSRENFVVKLDYESGSIKWLFGDPSKHWYIDYPSLRAVALKLVNGNSPIGQHTVTLISGGIMLFNNGTGSLRQPVGTAPGASLPSSAAVKYAIDELAKTARTVWTYEHVPPLLSGFCSSAVQAGPDNYLVAYSFASEGTRARLTAIDAADNVVFDYEYPSPPTCATIYRAAPVPFESLRFK